MDVVLKVIPAIQYILKLAIFIVMICDIGSY